MTKIDAGEWSYFVYAVNPGGAHIGRGSDIKKFKAGHGFTHGGEVGA